MAKISKRDQHFYGGLLTALIVIDLFDQPTIIEEIMGTLGEDGRKELIKFAKENDEYKLAGLDEWEENAQ